MVYSPSPSAHHLPEHATPFVGRHSEISDITSYLNNADCRLLTLTGFGGIGKTRLATEVATAFDNSTYFVALAPLTSSDLLATTIADKLDITLSGAMPPSDQLLMELEQKEILLLLDNFEHIMAGKQLVSDILAHAPQVTLLVTSRERLMLPEETVYDLKGMSLPATDEVPQIEAYSALLLFEQIAQKVDWRFSLNEEQLPHVIRICRLGEGIPLAIEMAASWVRVLSCREIADELAQSYALLKATHGHIPSRHQSIRVVFDYSWALLTEAERLVFQKMAVFRSGFRREAAQQITGATLDGLLSLVDKSLLQHDTNERYHLHELLRQFAKEKLEQNPENVSDAYDQHGAYYADFLDERKTEFIANEYDSPIVTAINSDLDNVRLMWDWAIAHHQFDAIDRASDGFYHYCRIYDANREATEVFQKTIAMIEEADSFPDQNVLLARLLSMLAFHANLYGMGELATKAAHKGLSLARTLDIPTVEARCLSALGGNAITQGMYVEACQYLEASIKIYDVLDETSEDLIPRLFLGWSYQNLGEYNLARQHYRQMVSIGKQRKADEQVAWGFLYLGHLNNLLGHFAIGQQYCVDALEVFERIGWLVGLIAANKNLANSYSGLGQYDKARHHFCIALMSYINHGTQMDELAVNVLILIANLLAMEGDIARAIELTSFVQQHPRTSAGGGTVLGTRV